MIHFCPSLTISFEALLGTKTSFHFRRKLTTFTFLATATHQIRFAAMYPSIVITLLLCHLVSGALLHTHTPPLLDVPTYSLATFNKDGSTNMNIMTYATPVSVTPNRVWSLGLYRDTLTQENLLRKPVAVLQLLTTEQISLVRILGGTSGRDEDKKAACAKEGFEWINYDEFQGISVLPGCAAYLYLTVQGGLLDAGSHLIVPYCQVEAMYTTEDAVSPQVHLMTSKLRELGIITEQGRVADIPSDPSNRGFRLNS
jgi:flavin reductase (DIM6/NTAB) family NADH-FMN oxidoreductase RutF